MIESYAGKMVMFTVNGGRTVLRGRVVRDSARTIVIEYQGKHIKRRRGRGEITVIGGSK